MLFVSSVRAEPERILKSGLGAKTDCYLASWNIHRLWKIKENKNNIVIARASQREAPFQNHSWNNRMRSISFSISLCYAPPLLSPYPPPPSTSTYSGSSSRSVLFQNSLECVPFLCITYPQYHKINCTINFLSSLENHANKTFSEKSSCPVSGNNLLWVLLWKHEQMYVLTLKFQSYHECKNNDTNIHVDECSPCLAYDFELPTFRFS